jgi:hypothetical protein
MNKQELIDCLDHIRMLAERGTGNYKAIILNVDKLKHCIMQCECPAIPDHADYPAILREQAI